MLKFMRNTVKTIADIAKLAGVSKSTVSRALNDSPLISQKTRKKIQSIARSHSFEAHQGARCLSLQRSNTLALIVPVFNPSEHFMTDPFLVEILRGVMQATSERKYDLLIAQPQCPEIGSIKRYVDSKRADGLIMICCSSLGNAVAELAQQKIPLIVWGEEDKHPYCTVDCDNISGSRQATQHLLQLGRKRIALIGGCEGSPETILRYQGYAESLQKAGLPLDPALVSYGSYSSSSGYNRMTDLLAQNHDIDAVFACSDLIAFGAISAIRESGRCVPHDISVVGFDDIPLTEHSDPPLTTISQNISKAGEILVHNLMQYLTDGIISHTVLPVKLVERKSTALLG